MGSRRQLGSCTIEKKDKKEGEVKIKGAGGRRKGGREKRKKKGGRGLSNHNFVHMARTTKINLISARGNSGHNFEVHKLCVWQLCLPSVNSSSLVDSL